MEQGAWKPLRASRRGPNISHLFFADDLILFAKKIVDQAWCIKKGIDVFCNASGQQVSFDKSRLFVSPNLHEQIAGELSRTLGSLSLWILGPIWGHRLIHKGRSSMMESDLVQRVRSKMEGWKSHFLSRAGRMTLAKRR